MRVKEVTCKYALSRSRLPGYYYALNPYRGCGHGCIYCYAPDVLREARKWGTFVDVKRNLPTVLSKEVKKKKEGVVGIGTVTDAYQPKERKYKITRMSLEQLLREDFPICIQTKSDLVLRDMDLITKFSDAEVGFTTAFLSEGSRKLFEPNAPPIENRLSALRALHEEGVRTWAFVGPILPHVRTEEFIELVHLLAESGVEKVMVDKLNLKKGTRKNILSGLQAADEGLRQMYSNLSGKAEHFRNVADVLKDELRSLDIEFELAF